MSNDLQVVTGDIYGVRESFNAVLSEPSINFDREASFALQVLQGNEFTLSTAIKNRQSLVDAITNVAAIGISLNPAKKQAYLVPRKGKICLDISYIGLIDMAVDSGSVQWAQAEVVYANDGFSLNGLDRPPTHTHNPFSKDRGEMVGVYVVAKTKTGDYLTETMTKEEIDSIMARSESVKSGKASPWKTDYNEMARKTVVKRAAKYWPRAMSDNRLSRAIEYLNTANEEGIAAAPESEAPSPTAFYPDEGFNKNLPVWTKLIESGKKTADDIIATVQTKAPMSDAQQAALKGIKVIEDAKEKQHANA